MTTDAVNIVVGFLQGFVSSSVFILILLIGFCVVIGLLKLKRTAGRDLVVKNLDERMTHKPVEYMPPTTPRGPADQLRAPELLESKV